MLVCPNRRLTVSMGTPCDKSTVVAFVCLATCVLSRVLKPHCLPISFSTLLQLPLLGTGNTRLSLASPLYFSMIRKGTSNRRMLDSVLVFFLRVIIHRLPSKNICRLLVVRFFTSEYANPVNTENRNKSLTSSWVLFFIGASMSVCISCWVRYPLSTLSGELIYPAKGLNGRRPSFLAMEMMCFNTIM